MSSLERTIGYVTAIGEVSRESGSVIGNSLKSIMSRITSVPGAVKALDEIGISVKDSAGEMRSFDDILDDLGAQWHNLSKEQQQNLGIQIAGKHTCQPNQKWLENNVLNSGKVQGWITVSQTT